jgi:hypothetical protein
MPFRPQSVLKWRAHLLPLESLKSLLHERHKPLTKLLAILANFENPASIAQVKDRAKDAGFKIPKPWNVSTTLTRAHGKAIRTPLGWELQPVGQQHLSDHGIQIDSAPLSKAKIALNKLVEEVNEKALRSYLYEVTSAFDANMYRSAIVMSWLAAIFVLQQDLIAMHLKQFNDEMTKVNSSLKKIQRIDQLGSVKESEQLVRMCAIGMFSKSIKKELESCLDRRNSCGHPTDVQYGHATAEHHIEILLNNVFLIRR